jgi:hypothetical protein
MAKLIQICASENDLFGLDGDGEVYQYNFKTNVWLQLGHGRNDNVESAGADVRVAGAHPRPGTAASLATR